MKHLSVEAFLGLLAFSIATAVHLAAIGLVFLIPWLGSTGELSKRASVTDSSLTRSPASPPARGAFGPAGFVVLAVGLLFYFLPSLIAFARSHHNRGAILATNLLLGWIILGWIIAIIWAFTSPPPAASIQVTQTVDVLKEASVPSVPIRG